MFHTMPAKLTTLLGTSAFRLGPSVPVDGVNLAFIRSQSIDAAENLQILKYFQLIEENQLDVYIDESVVFGQNVSPGTTMVSISDRTYIDGDGVEEYFRYKAFCTWFHIEGYIIPSSADQVVETQDGNLDSQVTERWYEYSGNRIHVETGDGIELTDEHRIYIRPYDVVADTDVPYLQNAFKILVYLPDTQEDLFIVYDKGEIRGHGINVVTGHEQTHVEPIRKVSILQESPYQTSRTFNYVNPGTVRVNADGDVRIFMEDVYSLTVETPTYQDIHGAWFVRIRKGSLGIDYTQGELAAEEPNMSNHMRNFVLPNLKAQAGGSWPVDSVIRMFYTTEQYSQNRLARLASQGVVKAIGQHVNIEGNTAMMMNGPILPHMPIHIEVEEPLADFSPNRPGNLQDADMIRYVITNDEAHLQQNLSPLTDGVAFDSRYVMPITAVDGNVVYFDNRVLGKEKVFGFATEARSWYHYSDDYIPYTGYQKGDAFFKMDFNPSMDHTFAAEAMKPLRYSSALEQWTAGVNQIDPNNFAIYDRTAGGLQTPIDPSELSPETDLLAGTFKFNTPQDYIDKDLVLKCMAAGVPGYDLMTTPVVLKMLPYKVAVVENDIITASVGVSYDTEYIVHSTTEEYQTVPKDHLILAEINVVPNTLFGHNVIFDTRSRGGGLKEEMTAVEGERHFWDIGPMDGMPYTGNMALVVEVPNTIRNRFLEEGMSETDIETMVMESAKKHAAAGSLIMVQYV